MSSGARSLQFAVNQLADMVEDAKGKGAFGVTTEVKSGKDYDPTAAAREEKERRELRHRVAMEKKQAKEFAECTFKPTVSRKSVEMLQTTHKERPSLHTPGKGNLRTTYKGEQTLEKPQINETSRMLMAGKQRQGPIYERLLSEGEELKRQKELAAEERARQEVESVVGVPQIDKGSANIIKGKQDSMGETLHRLTTAHVDKKRETIKRLEEEREAELKAQTTTKIYTNARSQQLARKLEAAGNTAKSRMYAAHSSGGSRTSLGSPPTSAGAKSGSNIERSSRPATAPQHRQGSSTARATVTPRALASTRIPADPKFAPQPLEILDGIDDVNVLRAEFERLVAQREATAAKAVDDLQAAVARARDKEITLEQTSASLTSELSELKKRCSKLTTENDNLRQEKKKLSSEVEVLTHRQNESDINEEHLNEKLKAITEKCQAVLMHNSKLQEQLNKSKALGSQV